MNIKKTSVITLIALLSCDTFAASSIVRAGVTPLGQSTGVRATPSAGNSTNRASLGIGSYYDINKLRPNRTQTSAGGSTGGSTGGSSNNVSNSALESVRQELTQELTEVKTTLTEQISDLVKLVEAKNTEIQNLKSDLAEATAEIEQIADKKYVTESDLGDQFNKIKEEAVSRAINAVNNLSYATGSYVDQEIKDLRSEITSARDAALESYAKKEAVKAEIATAKQDAIKTAADNVTAQGYISAATVTQDIKAAKDLAIKDAVEQAKLAVQDTLETYATKKYADDAASSTLKTIENNYATNTDLTNLKSEIIDERDKALLSYVTIAQAQEDAETVKQLAAALAIKQAQDGKLFATPDEVSTAKQAAIDTAVADVKALDYATNDQVTNLNSAVTESIADLQTQITDADDKLSTLETQLGNATQSALDTETVNGLITTALSDGKYITQAKLDERAREITQSISDLDETFATKTYVDGTFANASVIGQIQSEIIGLGEDIIENNTGWTTNKNTLDTLKTDLITAQTAINNLQTGVDGAIKMENVTEAIDTALANKKYATTADLAQRVLDIQGWVNNDFATIEYVGTEIKSAKDEIGIKLANYATVVTVNALQEQLNTTDGNLEALTERTAILEGDAGDYVTNDALGEELKPYATNDTLAKYVTRDEITNAFDDTKPLITLNTNGKLTFDKDNFNAAVLPNLAGYVTNEELNTKLGGYATTGSQGQYVTRDEITNAFDDTKPLITLNTNGKLMFNKDSFDAAVNGVTNVASMQGLYNWFIGTGTTNGGGWFKQEGNAFTLKTGADQGFAKSIADLKEVGTNNSLFVQTSDLSEYAKITDVEEQVNKLPSSEKEMPEKWQKSIFDVLAFDNTKPLVREDGDGKWTFQVNEFNAAVQTNLAGYVQDSTLNEKLDDYAKTADIEKTYATQVKLAALEKELDEDYIKTDDLASKIVNSYRNGYLKELPYATKSELTTEIAKITQEVEDVNSLNSRVTALEAYKTGDLGIVAGELIQNEDFMDKILGTLNGDEINTDVFVKQADLVDYAKKEYVNKALKNLGDTLVVPDGSEENNNTKPLIIYDGDGTWTYNSKDFDQAVLANLGGYATKEELEDVAAGEIDLTGYATKEEMNTALENLGKTLVVPDGSEENNNTKPLIIYDGDGTWTYNSKDFDQAVNGVENVANMQGLYKWLVGDGTGTNTWFKKTTEGLVLNEGVGEGFATSVVGVDLTKNATLDSTFVKNADLETKLSGSATIKNLSDALAAEETARKEEVEDLKYSVSDKGLKETLTTEKEGQLPLLEMLTTAAGGDSTDENALLFRALTTNDAELLSNALVFEVSEKDGGEKVPLVLSLKKEENPILASQTDYTKLSSKYTELEGEYTTLDGNYRTLNTTVGSLYGTDRLFTRDDSTKTLSLNAAVFSNEMATAISTAKGNGQCGENFKPNDLTTALALTTCKTSSTSE
ncbi:MAG: hypothetical protein R8M70_03195 [Alphaproteobacteria bacterium]|nr:hypothetical protein [Alphaproteobacteria bacterium]